MNAAQIQKELIEVLQGIQSASGLECPPLEGGTKPIDALPQFDSKIWPVAVGMLGAKLGIDIPPDVNLFRRDKTTIALTIDEAVQMVIDLVQAQAGAQPKTASGA
jgi:hypothetical protein